MAAKLLLLLLLAAAAIMGATFGFRSLKNRKHRNRRVERQRKTIAWEKAWNGIYRRDRPRRLTDQREDRS